MRKGTLRNHRKRWTLDKLRRLGVKAANGYSTRRIARELGRTAAAVKSRASRAGILLNRGFYAGTAFAYPYTR